MAREERGIIRLHAITPLPTHGVHGEKNFKAPGLEPFGDIPLRVGVRNQEEPLRSSGCRVTGFISRCAGNAVGSSTHFHRTPHSYPSIEYQQNAPALTGWHRHDWARLPAWSARPHSLTMREIVSRCPSGEPGGTGNDGEGVAEGDRAQDELQSPALQSSPWECVAPPWAS